MRNQTRRYIVHRTSYIVLAVWCCAASPAWAGLGTTFIRAEDALEVRPLDDAESPVAPYVNAPLDKLSRGVTNIFSSPLEWPATMHEITQEHGRFRAWTVGPVQGAGRFVLRLSSGLVDVVSFPLPIPRRALWVRRPSLFFQATDRALWVIEEARTAQHELGRVAPPTP